MTLWVALETSSRDASIALRCDDATVYRRLAAERAHATDLLPQLGEMLAEVSLTPSDIDGIVIGTGPGSYTGLRVGIATALGLARGVDAALVALASLEALAYGELSPGEQGLFVSDAHAGALYVARYARDTDGVRALIAPAVCRPDDVGAQVDREPARVFADSKSATLLDLEQRARGRLTLNAKPCADALLELGERRFAKHGPSAPDEIQPLYLRPYTTKARKR